MAKSPGLKKNFLYSISYQILNIILPLITAPYVTRVLGAKGLGAYSKSQAWAHYFLLFAMLGVNNYGNRAIARVRDNRHELSKSFLEIYSFQVITAVLSITAYSVYCFAFASSNKIVYILQAFYVLSGLLDVNWFCFGMEKFKLTTIRSMIVRIITAVLVFTLVNSKDDLWLYTFIISFGYVASTIVIWPFIKSHIDFVKPSWTGIKKHIKPNLVLFWPVLAVSLYNIMDKIMLGWFCEDEEVAFYTYAERIVTIPTTLILALDNVIMPRMSNLFTSKENSSRIKYLMDNVMLFAMFMAAAMGFGLAGVSNVFTPWFYGSAFTRCGFFIILLSPVIVIKAWAGALRTQFIIPTGKDKIYVLSLTSGAIINVILNLLLIPQIDGVGAIIGTLAAELAVCLIQFICCRKYIDLKKYLINGFSLCFIGAIMLLVVLGLSNISNNPLITMTVQISCGAVVYVLLSSFYMVKISKTPTIVNEILKVFRIKYRFK